MGRNVEPISAIPRKLVESQLDKTLNAPSPSRTEGHNVNTLIHPPFPHEGVEMLPVARKGAILGFYMGVSRVPTGELKLTKRFVPLNRMGLNPAHLTIILNPELSEKLHAMSKAALKEKPGVSEDQLKIQAEALNANRQARLLKKRAIESGKLRGK